MNYRTLEEYKKEVFDKLNDETKLKWLYEMSKQLCEVEELKEKYLFLNEMNESNYNKYCDTLKENNELRHIIDKLEKWLVEEIKHYKEHFEFVCKNNSLVPSDDTRIILEKDDLIIQKLESTLNKLQELKGSDINV